MSDDVSVVLVHGAWAEGSGRAKVIAPLAASGVKAVPAPLPLTSFADDVAALDRMVERAAGERMKARVRSHPVDHTPIVTAPDVVVDIIREAIAAVSAH
jgi:hypothetical protein